MEWNIFSDYYFVFADTSTASPHYEGTPLSSTASIETYRVDISSDVLLRAHLES